MQFKSIKAIALATTAVMALSFPNNSQAADNITMNAVIEAMPALDVIKVRNMEFGRWILTHDGAGGDIDLVMDTAGNITPTAGGTSTAIEIDTNASSAGRIDVMLPVGLTNTVLDMTVATPTVSGVYSLADVTYATATEGANTDADEGAGPVDVTVVTGGVPEVVSFGGTMTINGTPAVGVNSAVSFLVTLAY